MDKEIESLVNNIEKLSRVNPTEHVYNILKAALSSAPFCGGVASLINDYIPNGKMKRIEEFTVKIASDLVRLQDQVDKETILKDEFAYIFERCYRGVSENYQLERVEAFRGILINSAISVQANDDEKEYFISQVGSLSILHIKILTFMATPIEFLKTYNISVHLVKGAYTTFMPLVMQGVSLEIIKAAFEDLHSYGFLVEGREVFENLTFAEGLDNIGNGIMVTALGKRFIAYCKAP